MLIAAFLLLVASPSCPAPSRSVAISVDPISGRALGGQAHAFVPARYQVGSFAYEGYGIKQTSSDPIFKELVLDQRFGLRHRCGNGVFRPSGWNARDKGVSRWLLKIDARVQSFIPSPGSLAAEERGARPVHEGYTAGATWPVSSKTGPFFLGLMHPKTGTAETLIVAFQDEPRPTLALVMAKMPIIFDTLSVLPNLHGPDSFIALDGFRDSTLTNVSLKIDEGTLLATHAKLTSLHPSTR